MDGTQQFTDASIAVSGAMVPCFMEQRPRGLCSGRACGSIRHGALRMHCPRGALSAAGRALGMPKAPISRRLVLLERQAGTPLVARSTRSLALTEAAQRYYDRVRAIVVEAEAAEAELTAGNPEPSGLLRISASVAYGQLVVAPRTLAFAARHPRVRIDLSFSDERVNVIAERFDLAIRMGPHLSLAGAISGGRRADAPPITRTDFLVMSAYLSPRGIVCGGMAPRSTPTAAPCSSSAMPRSPSNRAARVVWTE